MRNITLYMTQCYTCAVHATPGGGVERYDKSILYVEELCTSFKLFSSYAMSYLRGWLCDFWLILVITQKH